MAASNLKGSPRLFTFRFNFILTKLIESGSHKTAVNRDGHKAVEGAFGADVDYAPHRPSCSRWGRG
jgi:hypothetical protein